MRVVDLGMAIAGPHVGQLLAQYGAEVILVESSVHQQRGKSFPDPRVMLQRKVTMGDLARNKKSISINLQSQNGREILKRLILASDVVEENFSPRVMKRWQLDYPRLRELKPDLIMVSLPALGSTGPRGEALGAAATIAAFSGLYHVWSYENASEPAAPSALISDYTSAAYGALATIAALHHRQHTGEGQHIEISQAEALATLLGPVYLDYLVNGRIQEPWGNRHPHAALQGCYRCKADGWCVISIFSEDEWQAFCNILGHPSWCKDSRFANASLRRINADALDAYIEKWTQEYTARQVMRILQKAGVSAGVVQNGENLLYDCHLRERGFIVTIDHPETGPVEYPGLPIRLSGTPGGIASWPRLGEHNEYVLGELLGMSMGEIDALSREGVIA